MDEIYKLDDLWGNWSPQTTLIVASLWPITATVMLPVTAVGLVFGLLFHSLF